MPEFRKKLYFDAFDIFLVFIGLLVGWIGILLGFNYIIYDDVVNYIVKIDNYINELDSISVMYLILFILLFVNVLSYLRFTLTVYIDLSNRFEFEYEVM
jgi:hypothetical protein